MYLAGVPVRDEDVLDLVRLLHDAGFDDTAEALVVALEAGQAIVALTEPITIRFPSGAWEYVVTERVPDVGDTLVRDGKTWTVAGVTESVDGHRVITMAPEVVKSPTFASFASAARPRRSSPPRGRR